MRKTATDEQTDGTIAIGIGPSPVCMCVLPGSRVNGASCLVAVPILI